jgi:hypothetical protein
MTRTRSTCDFAPLSDAQRTRWRCLRCGLETEQEFSNPPVRRCDVVAGAGGFCRHLDEKPVVTIDADVLDCRCSDHALFACGLFQELVSLRPVRKDHAAIIRDWSAETRDKYRGRSCLRCRARALAEPGQPELHQRRHPA